MKKDEQVEQVEAEAAGATITKEALEAVLARLEREQDEYMRQANEGASYHNGRVVAMRELIAELFGGGTAA